MSEQDVGVVERLQDVERPGAPTTFSLEQILQLFAIACEKPDNYRTMASPFQWTYKGKALTA